MSKPLQQRMQFINARATVTDTLLADDEVRGLIAAALEKANQGDEAARDPLVGENNKPRMLQVSAWLCHAGAPNLNGAAFTEEDLREAVTGGMFSAPFFGMIDFNHDYTAYGVWYSVKFEYDAKAEAWGILAQGSVFAWRYREVADKVMAMMGRQGYVDVSMSCLASWYEPGTAADGTSYRIIRKPVFFTTSLLDVDPADPNGRGIASEDPDSNETDRSKTLTQASSQTGNALQEEALMKELIEKIEAMLGEQRTALQPLVEAAEQAATLRVELQTAQASLVTANEQLVAVQGQLAEATQALEDANKALETANTELASLREFKNGVETERAEAAQKALVESRLAAIPETARTALDKNEHKDAIVAEWAKLTEAEWQVRLESFNLTPSLADRTASEGSLSSNADGNKGGRAISRWSRTR